MLLHSYSWGILIVPFVSVCPSLVLVAGVSQLSYKIRAASCVIPWRHTTSILYWHVWHVYPLWGNKSVTDRTAREALAFNFVNVFKNPCSAEWCSIFPLAPAVQTSSILKSILVSNMASPDTSPQMADNFYEVSNVLLGRGLVQSIKNSFPGGRKRRADFNMKRSRNLLQQHLAQLPLSDQQFIREKLDE